MSKLRLALVLFLAGCTMAPNPTPTPSVPFETISQTIESALTKGNVKGVPWLGDMSTAAKDYAAIFAGMDGIRPTVKATGSESVSETEAKIALENTLTLGGETTTWPSTINLKLQDNEWHPEWRPSIVHPELTEYTRLRHVRRLSERAAINASGHQTIMSEQPIVEIGLDKSKLPAKSQQASAGRIATLVKIDPNAYYKRVAAAGEKAFVVAAQLSPNAVPIGLEDTPGALLRPKKAVAELYPGLFGNLLGKVGPATAEAIKASDGEIHAGDTVGTSGLQQRFDKRLRGLASEEVIITARKDADPPQTDVPGYDVDLLVANVTGREGTPLELSLEIAAQQKATKILANVKQPASLVAIQPSTGRVVALASSPASGSSPVASYSKHPPGSTFKLVTALALLRTGMSPDSPVDCPASIVVNGKRFGNYSGYPAAFQGRITLAQAVSQSCNTAFIAQRTRVSSEQLAAAAASLGFGVDYDSGFPSFYGSVPVTKDPVLHAANLIGQGHIEASPLAVANIAASIAAGKTVVGGIVPDQHPKAKAKPLTNTEATQLQTLMKEVVRSGSGRGLAGVATGAKTGTAQYGTAKPPKTHAWMMAYDGDLAVAVYVQDGASGSAVAGPLIKQYLK